MILLINRLGDKHINRRQVDFDYSALASKVFNNNKASINLNLEQQNNFFSGTFNGTLDSFTAIWSGFWQICCSLVCNSTNRQCVCLRIEQATVILSRLLTPQFQNLFFPYRLSYYAWASCADTAIRMCSVFVRCRVRNCMDYSEFDLKLKPDYLLDFVVRYRL